MNVKLGEAAARFKITQDDLHKLLQQETLTEKLRPGTSEFEIKMVLCKDKEQPEIIFKDQALALNVPEIHIRKLEDMGRSKEGLRFEENGFCVQIQVDLRSRR